MAMTRATPTGTTVSCPSASKRILFSASTARGTPWRSSSDSVAARARTPEWAAYQRDAHKSQRDQQLQYRGECGHGLLHHREPGSPWPLLVDPVTEPLTSGSAAARQGRGVAVNSTVQVGTTELNCVVHAFARLAIRSEGAAWSRGRPRECRRVTDPRKRNDHSGRAGGLRARRFHRPHRCDRRRGRCVQGDGLQPLGSKEALFLEIIGDALEEALDAAIEGTAARLDNVDDMSPPWSGPRNPG